MRSRMLVAGAAVLTGVAAVSRQGPVDQLPRIVAETERLNTLRETLALRFEGATEPTQASMLEVCRPVGMEALRIAAESGWTIRQLAVKYRNPANRADPEAERLLRHLEADTAVQGLWVRTAMDGQPGVRYIRRIVVRPACMPCHGSRRSRPAFIADGYPRDRAYDFEVGDVRGVYSVFVPDPE